MTDIILVVIIAFIVFGAAFYVYRAKKRGEKCIGCPHAKQCKSSKCNCNSSG